MAANEQTSIPCSKWCVFMLTNEIRTVYVCQNNTHYERLRNKEYYVDVAKSGNGHPMVNYSLQHCVSRGLFLESPGSLTGPKSYFEIKVPRKVGCALSSNEVHFVSLANNFTAPFAKLPSLMAIKNSLTGPKITGSFEKQAPGPSALATETSYF